MEGEGGEVLKEWKVSGRGEKGVEGEGGGWGTHNSQLVVLVWIVINGHIKR